MKLTSPDFQEGQSIPRKFAVEGENVPPTLLIEGVPSATRSLALLVEDPDVPRNLRPDGLWTHWLIWNIPTDTVAISSEPPTGSIVGPNGRWNHSYGGPNPPDGKHRYFFRLFALSSLLNISPESTREEFLSSIEGKIIEEAVLMGTYAKTSI